MKYRVTLEFIKDIRLKRFEILETDSPEEAVKEAEQKNKDFRAINLEIEKRLWRVSTLDTDGNEKMIGYQ